MCVDRHMCVFTHVFVQTYEYVYTHTHTHMHTLIHLFLFAAASLVLLHFVLTVLLHIVVVILHTTIEAHGVNMRAEEGRGSRINWQRRVLLINLCTGRTV